mmetsp:Transcript_36482/g.85266  ORF Transcript_36482/g.85266 Transcript_36482/m.85266 type:complete len:151 (+) Transcript_36482:129-581(+)
MSVYLRGRPLSLAALCMATAYLLLLPRMTVAGWFSAELDSDEPTLIPPNSTWGSFYDPKKIFCGEYDCYRILDITPPHERSADEGEVTEKIITSSYRALSRVWHPDKNTKDKLAKERFVVSSLILIWFLQIIVTMHRVFILFLLENSQSL